MTTDMMNFRDLLEKAPDADLLRDMIGFAAHSLKLRFVVMTTLVRSESLFSRGKSIAPPAALNGSYPSSSRTTALICCGHVQRYRNTTHSRTRHIWAAPMSFMISDTWQPVFGATTVGCVEHAFHPDGAWGHRLVGGRGLAHHDLALFPGACGDVGARGAGMA